MTDRKTSAVRTPLVAMLVLASVFGVAFASNMGFKKVFSFTLGTPSNNLHWISLPAFYTPANVVGSDPGVDAADLATDMGGSTNIASVNRRHPTSGIIETWPCCGYPGTAFLIEKHRGYEIQLSATWTGSAVIVGSHDDVTPLTLTAGTPSNNLHWVSIPYHFSRDGNPLPPGQDAMDIAVDFGGASIVTSVNRRHPTSGIIETWPCCGYPGTAFSLEIGRGYEVQITANASWVSSHY